MDGLQTSATIRSPAGGIGRLRYSDLVGEIDLAPGEARIVDALLRPRDP
jgi:hypothetical protein